MLEEVYITGGQWWALNNFRYVTGLNCFLGTPPLQEQKKESCQINLPLLKLAFRNVTFSPLSPLHWVDRNGRVSVLPELYCSVSLYLSSLVSVVKKIKLGLGPLCFLSDSAITCHVLQQSSQYAKA